MNQGFQTPDDMLRHAMKHFGVGRETAIAFLTKGFEAALRVEGDVTDEKIDRKLAEMMVTEGRRRTPWLVNLMQAHYRKNLPAWEKVYDAALEEGQDPATRMSISQNVIMEMATERVGLIRMAKEGKSVEEITEAAFSADDKRSDGEIYLLIAKQMA